MPKKKKKKGRKKEGKGRKECCFIEICIFIYFVPSVKFSKWFGNLVRTLKRIIYWCVNDLSNPAPHLSPSGCVSERSTIKAMDTRGNGAVAHQGDATQWVGNAAYLDISHQSTPFYQPCSNVFCLIFQKIPFGWGLYLRLGKNHLLI